MLGCACLTQSPVTLMPGTGRPPAKQGVRAEVDADPAGFTAPPGVPTDSCDQLGEARHVLGWLIGDSDGIPVEVKSRGRFTGARDDYAHTDEEIRQVRDRARRELGESGISEPTDPDDARRPWRSGSTWMNAAWLRGVRDLLDWVLGDRDTSPLLGETKAWPALHELTFEDEAAEAIIRQGRSAGGPVNPDAYSPPQYGEAIQVTVRWLPGETTTPPLDSSNRGAYIAPRL